jgi:hypothetical protein
LGRGRHDEMNEIRSALKLGQVKCKFRH